MEYYLPRTRKNEETLKPPTLVSLLDTNVNRREGESKRERERGGRAEEKTILRSSKSIADDKDLTVARSKVEISLRV